jgi:hypothetical protein
MTLIEQNASRCGFLRESIEAMALTNVEVVQTSVQLLSEGEGRFDLVTSREVVMQPRVMFGLAAPLLEVGGTLVLWAPRALNEEAEAGTHVAARGVGLVPTGFAGSGRVCLHTFEKAESPAAALADEREPRSQSPEVAKERRKIAVNLLAKSEARIVKVSASISALEERRLGASGKQLPRLVSDIRKLEAHRAALVEQLEAQKSVMATQTKRHEQLAAQREEHFARLAAQRDEQLARLAAEYEREDRDGANLESRRLLAEQPVALDDLQSELVDRLRTDGIAKVELARLFSAEVWEELAEQAGAFTLEAEGDPEQKKVERAKELVRRRYAKSVELPPDDPWLRVALSPRLLDVVNAYLGLWAKLTSFDQWRIAPMPPGREPGARHRWRRDRVDRHLVKVFVFLSDVDASAGPFEYVAGSTGDGPYAGLWPWAPGRTIYPPPEELEKRVPASAIRALTGPAGTMVLCNTSGLHREGLATGSSRVLWRYHYRSPASLVFSQGKLRTDPGRFGDLTEEARFALT